MLSPRGPHARRGAVSARGEVLAKIAASEVPAVSGPPTALQEQLATAAEYRRHAQWHRLSPLLESLEQKAEDELLRARESLTAVTAPLAVRAELRGRLDAYKAKVARHGLAEDPLLIERYDAARRMLWSAPCDLRVAEQAVLRYQQAAAEAAGARGCPEQGGPADRRGECVSSETSDERVAAASGPAARVVRGRGRRRAVLRHLRSGPGRLADGHGGLAADRHHRRRQGRRSSSARAAVRARRGPPRVLVALVDSRAARCRAGCRAPCRAQSTSPLGVGAQLRRLDRGSSGRGRLGVGPGRRCRTCRGPTRARWCWRTPRCPSASGSARAPTAGRRWAVRAASGRAARRGSAPSAATRTRSCRSCSTGDIVHGQYEVVGCLAHGGLGWVYLAVDRAVSDRWVVLKGLLDTGDQDAMAAAISERRFLAEIEHSNIVRIYNFVEHLDQRTGSLDGYIVMEYVGGKSLKEIANGRRTPTGKRDPLPVEQACAYGIEALEALGHLHSRNLLYCDFKVDNAIQTEDQLKLIDMGAVRRMDDDESAIYGTVGYQAPEVAERRPVGRLRPVHGRAHAGRPDLRLPGLHERLRGLPARPRQHRGLPHVRVVLPAAGARHRPRPGPPVRLRAGDGGAADGRAARGRGRCRRAGRGPRCRRCSGPN